MARPRRLAAICALPFGRNPTLGLPSLGIRRWLSVRERSAPAGGRSNQTDQSPSWRGWRLVGRWLDYVETDIGGATVLVAAIVASIATSLYLTRGTTFWYDEFTLYAGSHGFDPTALVTQHNGQLILVPRLIYATIFALFGPDYVVVRVVEAVGVALVGAAVYGLARPRIGALALWPAIILMFLGYSWDSTLTGNGIINVYCVLPGLVALLALDRRVRFAYPLACVLLAASIASWSAGLGFIAGAAVLLTQRGELRRRAWVFAIPLLLWGIWWIVRPGLTGPLYGGEQTFKLSNVLLIPNYAASSFGAVLTAITGLSYPFTQGPGASPDTSWGPALAVIATIFAVLILRRRAPDDWPWPWFAVLATFWSATALVSSALRPPDAGRYVYVGAASFLVLTSWMIAPFRLTRRLALIALIALVIALGANIAELRDAGTQLRAYATSVRADLAAIEIARGHVRADFVPSSGLLSSPFLAGTAQARTYLSAVDRNGSFADTLPELREAPEADREHADQVLAMALRLPLTPAPSPSATANCSAVDPAGFRLRRGTDILGTTRRGNAAITLRRFGASFTVALGTIKGGRYYAIRVPGDAAPDPWWARVATSQPVRLCTP